MTGYGRGEGAHQGTRFVAEVRSVNHRFLELRVRLPPHCLALEAAIQERIRAKFQRGAIDVTVRRTASGSGTGATLAVDSAAARELVSAVRSLETVCQEKLPITAEFLWASGRVFVAAEEEDVELLRAPVLAAVDAALEELDTARRREGAAVGRILEEELAKLRATSTQMRAAAAEQPVHLKQKLEERLAQLRLEGLDPQRLAWEATFYADRADVGEELERLDAHVEAFSSCVRGGDTVGRRLDFLTQEMNREVNTLATKSALLALTQAALEGKSSVERLKEQVQNVE